MRVAILTRRFPPAASGIADHTDHIADELAARGHAVSVVCGGPADDRSAFDILPVIERWARSGVPAIARAVGATKPDVILWQYNPFEFGPRGLASAAAPVARALAAQAPLAVLFHELWFPWGRNGLRGLAWAVAQRRAAWGVLRAARAWIVTTDLRAAVLARRDEARTRRIPVGTNVDVRTVSARPVLGIPEGAFVVGHLGGTGPGKDLEPAFGAVRALRAEGIDARLLLAGRTGPLTPPEDLRDAVVLTGEVADLSPALVASDVYLHADHAGPSAGRRTSIVAALAHGLPLVSYRGPDHASELSDGENVVLVEPSSGALAHTLRALATDPARRAALGDAARRTYDACFSWRKIGDEVEATLVELGG